ncbi:MAG: TadE/TadG family type IV pilus assembly protein, partial [Thermaurantiacus sp.]
MRPEHCRRPSLPAAPPSGSRNRDQHVRSSLRERAGMSCASGLLADRRGSTAILTAFSLALVLGFVALGIEAARGLQVQRALQAAADSGP